MVSRQKTNHPSAFIPLLSSLSPFLLPLLSLLLLPLPFLLSSPKGICFCRCHCHCHCHCLCHCHCHCHCLLGCHPRRDASVSAFVFRFPNPKPCHFDRSCSRSCEQRSGETRFSTQTFPASMPFCLSPQKDFHRNLPGKWHVFWKPKNSHQQTTLTTLFTAY
jgi:hypothetical protein